MRGVIRTQERRSCLLCPVCTVLNSREHVRGGAWGARARARACVCWGGGAVVVAQFCGVGRQVRIRALRPAPPFNPRAGVPAPPTPARVPLGRQSLVGAARAFRTGGRGGAGAVRVSLEVLHEWCAVHGAARCGWTLRLPMPAWQKRAVRAGRHARVSGGTGEWRFRGALQLELVH